MSQQSPTPTRREEKPGWDRGTLHAAVLPTCTLEDALQAAGHLQHTLPNHCPPAQGTAVFWHGHVHGGECQSWVHTAIPLCQVLDRCCLMPQ